MNQGPSCCVMCVASVLCGERVAPRLWTGISRLNSFTFEFLVGIVIMCGTDVGSQRPFVYMDRKVKARVLGPGIESSISGPRDVSTPQTRSVVSR